jgi:hypothetical protein
MSRTILTQEQLKAILNYDPLTGIFTWLISPTDHIKAGAQSGSINSCGYWKIQYKGCSYLSHRLAWLYMTGNNTDYNIDHINGVKDDCRWINLREATDTQNKTNISKYKNNKSGFKGVSWEASRKKWIAQANFNGINKKLGRFDTPELASIAYEKFAIENHGDFYYKNGCSMNN